MKLFLIQTRNQSTAKRPSGLSTPPIALSREPPRPQTSERRAQINFVRDILNGLDLPLAAFGAYIKAHITFMCVPSSSTNEDATNGSSLSSKCIKFYCSGTSWTIAWSYWPSLQHTAAIMFHREGDGDNRKDEVLSDLLRLQTHLSHPMLLGYIKTKVSLSFTFDMLDDMNRETLALEQEIGFTTWNWVLDREMPGRGVGETQDQSVEGFNVLSGKLTNIRFRLKTFQQQIKFISRCNAQYRRSLDMSTTTFQSSLRECDELDSFMNVMWDYTFIHLFDADSLGERLQNAMSSVFQLTTQRDSRASLAIADINNELAWQGKTTNTSMMTIAFVSLLFLPGTFVASFFDTPIFNFAVPTDQGQVVVPQPFWIYWTVSGALTLGLALGWLSYLRHKRDMDIRERESERRRFRDRIRRRRGDGGARSNDAPLRFTADSQGTRHVHLHGQGQGHGSLPRDHPPPPPPPFLERQFGRAAVSSFDWIKDRLFNLRRRGGYGDGDGIDKRRRWKVENELYGVPFQETPTMQSNYGSAGKSLPGGKEGHIWRNPTASWPRSTYEAPMQYGA